MFLFYKFIFRYFYQNQIHSIPFDQIEETIDESAFFGASGCMKCLRKDQLVVLIDAAVKDQVSGLQSQLEKQNQRILMVRMK